jgi:glucose-6-phosphate dehydrogenase assembly protein OpcA
VTAATVQPDRILRELSELWVSFGKQNGDESSGVLRACAMTLVVLAEAGEDANAVGETLASLMREHPSRAIVVRVSESEEPALEARVFAQCWMPFGQRRQICCEQIEISASHGSLADLPAVILPLVVADLPVILWSRPPRLLASPAWRDLSHIATKTILDSAAFPDPREALRRFARAASSGLLLADLAWTRLTRWRELIAQIFENPQYFSYLPSITAVTIHYTGETPPAGLWYMAAWLRQCLERAGNKARVRWERTGGPCDSGLASIEFGSDGPSGLSVSVRRVEGNAAEVRVNSLVNRTVFPEASDYVLLREELSIPGHDPTYQAALTLGAQLVEET